MNNQNIKIWAMALLKRLGKYIFWTVGLIGTLLLTIAINRHVEDRASKKAEIDEYFRREKMTPQARIAEDEAKARAAKERKEAETRKRVEDAGAIACLAKWKASLKDPDSGVVTEYEGRAESNGDYLATINGRAKNSFGGYVMRYSLCRIETQNGKTTIELIDQP